MVESVLNFSPEVKKFVEDAMNNRNGKIPLNPGFTDDKYARSEFFQLRRACAISTVGVVPSNLDAGQVCNLVLVKATEEAQKGTPVTDPKHLLGFHYFIMQDKGYTKGADAGRKPEDAAALGAAAYVSHAEHNKSNAPKAPFIIDDPRNLPVGATKPVGFNNFKGMAFDSAFTRNVGHFLKRGYSLGAEVSTYFAYKKDAQRLSLQCREGAATVSYEQCYDGGLVISHEILEGIRKGKSSQSR